jgi:hypothetical protein
MLCPTIRLVHNGRGHRWCDCGDVGRNRITASVGNYADLSLCDLGVTLRSHAGA